MTIAPYKDTTVTNDHSYYGRGCKNGWGTGGDGGSQTPCADSDAGGRYVKTADNETQKNGTYYNFQAATVGAGGAMDTDKTDSSYTFCPLGWQLPYSGTGGDYYNKSRSWNYLFTTYSIAFADGTATDAAKIKSYPFSYVYSGYYNWYTGRLYDQSNGGHYWSSTVVSSTGAYYLSTWSSGVRPANTGSKAYGLAVRCVHPFIDGTVAGTDVVQYLDTTINHDHSYYGNGCPNPWGDDGAGGSDVSCSTRLLTTYNNTETQKNGTYYSFVAVTAGSGNWSFDVENANVPDTFCPLGWQLPYGGTGGDYYDISRSWKYLLDQYNYTLTEESQERIRSYPASYVYAGNYNWKTGRLYRFSDRSYHWSSSTLSAGSAYKMSVLPYGMMRENDSKLAGYSIRCGRILAYRRIHKGCQKSIELIAQLRL